MSRWYLDTSAGAKLLVEEAESSALARLLDTEVPDLVACYLFETELRRFVQRTTECPQAAATAVLDRVDLYDVPSSLFREAGLMVGDQLRSSDAIHLTAALRIGVDAVVTYDHRMANAAASIGLSVLQPGLRATG